ncbi:conserved hypothetical protein [Burkholderia multivorans CGD1]|nr:conserved hypothetical protein [Burkholderia multivorans CGD1]
MTASAFGQSESPAAEVQHSERANACTRATRPNAARQSRTIPYKSTHFYETFSTDFRAIAPHTAHCPTLPHGNVSRPSRATCSPQRPVARLAAEQSASALRASPVGPLPRRRLPC